MKTFLEAVEDCRVNGTKYRFFHTPPIKDYKNKPVEKEYIILSEDFLVKIRDVETYELVPWDAYTSVSFLECKCEVAEDKQEYILEIDEKGMRLRSKGSVIELAVSKEYEISFCVQSGFLLKELGFETSVEVFFDHTDYRITPKQFYKLLDRYYSGNVKFEIEV